MSSMDLNGGDGARVIMLLPDGRVALCTAEGKLELRRNRITRGPVRLTTDGRAVSVEFDGPALVVPNAAAYLRMEHALETGSIDHSAAFRCTLELRSATGPICFDPQFLSQRIALRWLRRRVRRNHHQRSGAPAFRLGQGRRIAAWSGGTALCITLLAVGLLPRRSAFPAR